MFVWWFIYIDVRWAECKSDTIAEVDLLPCMNAIRSFYRLTKEEEVETATCVVKKGDTMKLRPKFVHQEEEKLYIFLCGARAQLGPRPPYL